MLTLSTLALEGYCTCLVVLFFFLEFCSRGEKWVRWFSSQCGRSDSRCGFHRGSSAVFQWGTMLCVLWNRVNWVACCSCMLLSVSQASPGMWWNRVCLWCMPWRRLSKCKQFLFLGHLPFSLSLSAVLRMSCFPSLYQFFSLSLPTLTWQLEELHYNWLLS